MQAISCSFYLLLLFLLLLACSIAATAAVSADADVDYCTTKECKNERRHSMMIKEFQNEITKVKGMLQESGCSICNVEGTTPCLNNGTCIVTEPYKYICDCPDNTSGDDCGTLLSCDDYNPCGENADCTVFNHKKVCTCKVGYAGDPMTGCDLRSKTACMTGDPHYTTFDGTTFDYQGTCPYIAMASCSYDNFSIIATNIFTDDRKIVSMVNEFTFRTQGHEFRVDSSLNYFIDGVRQYYTNYWPSNTDPRIVATKPASQVIIQDNLSGAIITFSVSYLCVQVPLTETFFGDNKMCGLWGSINDNCLDDIKDKSGNAFTQPPTCVVGTNLQAINFMDTWVTNSTVNNCVEGGPVTNMTGPCDPQTTQLQCDLIAQALNGQGPFAACNALGHDVLDKWYHDCTFDVCQGYPRCDALDNFATLCIDQLPFVNIDDWREGSQCPYPCPPHSHYSLRTPKCQDSCSDPNYSNSTNCHDGNEEGCKCDAGYYFDPNGEPADGFTFACRPLGECGCVDANGNYYPPHKHWLNDDCTIETECTDGQLISQPVECSIDGQCNNVDGFPTCQCLPGYQGDGFNCTDINECLDPSVCSVNVGQGICTNLPGTYNCTCYSPFSGAQCTDYKPSRHCADLRLFHGFTQNGTYSISIGADYSHQLTDADLEWTEVFCDMESSDGGGWTLMSHGNRTSGKTYAEFVGGFGNPEELNAWLGLENIFSMTTQSPTSLRVIIERCPNDEEDRPDMTTECTYPYFTIANSSSDYAVFLNASCRGTENLLQDGWITWNRREYGPKFRAFDTDDSYNCSAIYHQTGWWFNHVNSNGDPCGSANLNGLRYTCGGDENQYNKQYLTWANYAVEDAFMYLRPIGYPDNYDHRADPTSPPPFETTSFSP